MYDFDVFLFTYNHLEMTINCIKALYKNTTEFNFLLTVVDDSKDEAECRRIFANKRQSVISRTREEVMDNFKGFILQ